MKLYAVCPYADYEILSYPDGIFDDLNDAVKYRSKNYEVIENEWTARIVMYDLKRKGKSRILNEDEING